MTNKILKKQKLRNNEYYNTQEMFDELYDKSNNKPHYRFYKLLELIVSPQNVELAYRNIKRNTGSKTAGINQHTISYLSKWTNEEMVTYVKRRMDNYFPHEVRRVDIPKPNGKTRPLGIPSIEDRLIQQCIKQVLEPICEAKFYGHSYGFRPNRSAHHALTRTYFLVNKANLHYVVDIDIKGFFDNIQHGKLLKQLWSLGIQDKRLLKIISKMLKAPIKKIGIPEKGTPQGGILSPLLSNVVLNELDWWIASQWEHIKTRKDYSVYRENRVDKSNQYKLLRKSTSLKEVFIVRYADDFKLFCKDYKTAQKLYTAVRKWLKERLGLDISEEKSKIVNLRKNYSEFLGVKLKARQKGKRHVVHSHICDKATEKIQTNLKKQIKEICRSPSEHSVNQYNAMVLGIQNYYKIATCVNLDLAKIAYLVGITIYNRAKSSRSKSGKVSKVYTKLYGKYNCKKIFLCNLVLYPIAGVKHKSQMGFTQTICDYTKLGRALIHEKQKIASKTIITQLIRNPIKNRSIEYNENRISKYISQKGKCPISKEVLEIHSMHCHHIVPLLNGGTDAYNNLIIITEIVHKLIHATKPETIEKYLNLSNLNQQSIKKLNKYRILVGNSEI
ncbi:group II intron reverse transcriptase/maturase [Oceanobacillus jeddahense]|uniref:group II intron reverse transcriptase/maturase n=1 Tax=Oceanobacillus jeddahense TaxID=1462527 RepID=UPI00363F895A